MRVIVTCEVNEAMWGTSDLIQGCREDGHTEAEIDVALQELFDEDMETLLMDATWSIERDKEL